VIPETSHVILRLVTELDRIVAARMKLMSRWRARMDQSPAVADRAPMGEGPLNRHGMPRIPVGQTETHKWPVLDLGIQPEVPTARWRLRVDGAVRTPVDLTWDDFMGLEQIEDVSDFHCVTTWSRCDVRWGGVRVSTVLALAEPTDEATHLLCHAFDGYSTNLPLEEALKEDVLLVHRADDAPLEKDHGGPVRMITPQLYAWKGAKWISRIQVTAGNVKGFWEQRGYSDTAHPWRDDRYG
jgi:DMSO/TMAO reductase YedYZ molybdopterin-dependent catalytic subunit